MKLSHQEDLEQFRSKQEEETNKDMGGAGDKIHQVVVIILIKFSNASLGH